MEPAWIDIKHRLKSRLPASGFKLWIEPLQASRGSQGELVLGCPNAFTLHWVRAYYLELIREEVQQVLGKGFPFDLRVLHPSPRKLSTPLQRQPVLPGVKPSPIPARGLNQSFTFEHFVVGASNRFAFQASQALARNDTVYGRTLFLTSLPGLGKSHLSQAVGNHIYAQGPDHRVFYLTAEDFANEMVLALKQGQIERFKEKFRRQTDILLLEDVHFLSGKEKIQSELCYTLDCLADQQKKLVFTSSYVPTEIPGLKKELCSRLSAGVITPIEPPDFDTRVKILAKKSDDRGIRISRQVLECLATYVTQDVRQMESALDSLVVKSSLLSAPITIGLAEEVLHNFRVTTDSLSMEAIQRLTCKVYQISLEELTGRSRKKKLVRSRNLAIYLCRHYTQKTLKELARAFRRTHSTILHALDKVERELKISPALGQELKFLEQKLQNPATACRLSNLER
ncbi:MAG: chromosomal replication initiator protein DnaA [Deltaproteobacteria bacterium]|nr:chromosomal replication initiator protein DnaA [Deltaproteobacteria bacterium]MBW1951695.1 chromosomal replication initiator protein DnaA [Deltaproteobacteria bacterium]MBW1987566.1 chromosomal replication initiator protein DnaA [Deltaproteobacteria bacterium]MBW2134708.1 chromosomal replication initiator protein DnaA [Deltaproteobacteria bacterium]